jgi:hypothetical protein
VTVETSSVSGWKRSGERKDVSVGGGGTLDYAKVRNAVEIASVTAGWKFQLEGGRMPWRPLRLSASSADQTMLPKKKPRLAAGFEFLREPEAAA